MIEKKSTALLFFSRSPSEEAAHKSFAPRLGRKGNVALARELIRRSLSESRKTGLSLFTFFSADQQGHTFGERLANALEALYAKGFEKVIAIGNDCPDLTAEMIQESQAKLARNEMVLGPATDGGVYLIGLDRKAYHREQFLNLPWEKTSLQEAFAGYAIQGSYSLKWLEVREDIDFAAGFRRFLNALPQQNGLRKRLLSIISSYYGSSLNLRIHLRAQRIKDTLSLRGPPQ